MCVPLVDGSFKEIEQLMLSTAIKTLGLMTCPTGSNSATLEQIQQQGQE
jgi:hypothetical protein